MKSRLLMFFLLLALNFSSTTSILAGDIKIQRVVSTGTENNCITQDKDGMFWVGVWGKGLFCYNGNELTKAKIGNGENPVPITWSIFTDSEGIIWFVVADHGLYSYDKKSGACREYKAEAGNANTLASNHFNVCSCNDLAEDKEGLIWIGTTEGLSSYNKKTEKFTQYKNNPNNTNSLSNDSVWAVFTGKDGLIWIGTEDGLNCYDKNSGKFCRYKNDPNDPNSISDSYVRAIAEDKEGSIWIGTKSTGIDKFDRKARTFTNYRHDTNNSNSISYNQIHHLMVDRYNNLWICNDGNVGLDLYNIRTNTFSHYSYDLENPNTISSNSRLCSFEDNSGIVWLIDNSGGLNKCIWQNNVFKSYIHNPKDPSSISSDNLAKIYEDRKGNIWIGTYKGGMCLYTKEGKFENFSHDTTPLSLPGVSVHSILDASDNKLWLGVEEGFICLFDVASKQVVKSFQNPCRKLTPAYLTQDNKTPNILWFACSYAEGLFNFNTMTGEFTAYKHDPHDKNSVSNENTFSILQDGDVLWISTGGDGLCKFDKTTGKSVYYKYDLNNKNSISGNIVIDSFIDSKSRFWVTTDDGGLNKFDKQTGKFTNYGVDCGFPSKCTRHILEDNDGSIWVSTDSGIVKFDPEKLKVIKWFKTADGIPSNDFEDICSAIKDSKGNFWFSTVKGLCKFTPEEASKIESNPHIPPIVLSSFKSKEGSYYEEGFKNLTDVKLKWPDNSFKFTFAALDYMDPEKNQYAYKLEGFDKNWNYIGTGHYGRYTNVPPGEYTLNLKGSNNDGVWNETGLSINIAIIPPFWMTLWFKASTEIAILCIIGGVFLLIIRALKKKAIYMRNHAIAEATAQVAHDIRSPLAALNTALKDLRELPEQKRILIRNATRRISDIANNLLIKYKMKKSKKITKTRTQKDIKAELISSLLDSLISEKRAQTTEKSIDIVLELGNNTHNCFVDLESEKFKRIISNLINNAFEAVETNGIIRVILRKQYNDLVIEIIDNGNGMPEDILLKIKQGRISSSKKEGFGLGISNAIQSIKSWKGSYDIQSKEGEGTTFTITLPIAEEPDWFQSTVILSPNKHIIVLDDDESIHNVWESHFLKYIENKLITLEHFYDPPAFIKYCKTSRSEQDLFLVDYEFVNSMETGLDLIEQLDLKKQTILVTSRYEEPEIKGRTRKLEVKIIPKSFAPYVSISMVNETTKEEHPELIFIDDDKALTEAWKMRASFINKKIATFNRSGDFKKVMDRYNKDIPIYIDSDLREEIPGEIFAKFLYEQGFHNLYLATGYEKDNFGHLPWIKEVVNKEAPF